MYTQILPLKRVPLPRPFAIAKSFNLSFDFCVWVLQHLGLHVSPFTAHVQSANPILSPTGWQRWCGRVVAARDIRLLWHIQDVDSALAEARLRTEQWITSALAQGASISDSDRTALIAHRELQIQCRVQAYETAVQHYPEGLERRCSPPAAWHGSEEARILLEDLWQQYQQYQRVDARFDAIIESDEAAFYAEVERLGLSQDTSFLSVNFVHYPTLEVFWCGSATVIVGVPAPSVPYQEKILASWLELSRG